jgi:flagellar protein FlaG
METTGILSGVPIFKPAPRPSTAPEGADSLPQDVSAATEVAVPTQTRVVDASASSSSAQSDLSGERRREEQTRKLEEAVEGANKFFQSLRRTLQFNLNNDYGRLIAQIKDSETGDLVRQIPSEEMLELARRLDELSGLLFKEKV